MQLVNYYLKAFKNYAVFSGRAHRAEYWYFVLGNFIAGFVLGLIDSGLTMGNSTGLGLLGALYGLVVLIPGIAITVRRLHDTDRSGLWWLIGFVPVVGWIILIVFMVLKGNKGKNKYGPEPGGEKTKAAEGAK